MGFFVARSILRIRHSGPPGGGQSPPGGPEWEFNVLADTILSTRETLALCNDLSGIHSVCKRLLC